MNRFIIYVLAIGAFVLGTVDFVVAGILDVIAQDMNVSIAMAGQLVTVYSISFVIGSLVLVALTARLERKKVLILSLVIFLAGNAIAFVSYQFEVLMLSRVVLAISGGLYTVVASNYAARIAAPGKRGTAIAIITTGFSASLVLGVPIGTFIAAYMDWHSIYLIVAIITLLLIIIMIKFIPLAKGDNPVPVKEQLLVIKNKQMISGLLTTLFWIMGYSMIFTYISPLLRSSAGFSMQKISITLMVLGIFALIGSRFGGFAVDKWGAERTIKLSLMIHTICLLVLPITAITLWGAVITIMIWGAATWTTTPAIQLYLISLRPQSSEITLSYNTAVLNTGITLGAVLGGVVIENMPILNLGWISGMVVLTAFGSASYSFMLRNGRIQDKIAEGREKPSIVDKIDCIH